MAKRILYIPFQNDAEVFGMARTWVLTALTGPAKKVLEIVRRHDHDSLEGKIEDGGTLYILGHGSAGCGTITNKFKDADEEIDYINLANLVAGSGLEEDGDGKRIKLYACQAGAGRSSSYAARFTQKMICGPHYFYNYRFFGYTLSVTSPEVINGTYGKWAVNDSDEYDGRANECRLEFNEYGVV